MKERGEIGERRDWIIFEATEWTIAGIFGLGGLYLFRNGEMATAIISGLLVISDICASEVFRHYYKNKKAQETIDYLSPTLKMK